MESKKTNTKNPQVDISATAGKKVGKFLAHFQHTVDSAILWGSEKLDDFGNAPKKDDHQVVSVLRKGAKFAGSVGKEFFATTEDLKKPVVTPEKKDQK